MGSYSKVPNKRTPHLFFLKKKSDPQRLSMKFCLLVTVALDIFIKEKNNILYYYIIILFYIIFYAKGVYSVKLSGKVLY